MFDMEIIPLNIHNVIRRRLFEDDIEDVATGPNVEKPAARVYHSTNTKPSIP